MKKYSWNTHVGYNLSRPITKRLKNLNKVVINWLVNHEYIDSFYATGMSPKKLVFALYLALRSREQDLKNKDNYICGLVDRNNQLQERIKELEEYEKQVIYEGYKFVITTYQWSCGDGCCSDSWAYHAVYDREGKLIEGRDYPSSEKTYTNRYRLTEELKEKYGQNIDIRYQAYDSDKERIYEDY